MKARPSGPLIAVAAAAVVLLGVAWFLKRYAAANALPSELDNGPVTGSITPEPYFAEMLDVDGAVCPVGGTQDAEDDLMAGLDARMDSKAFADRIGTAPVLPLTKGTAVLAFGSAETAFLIEVLDGPYAGEQGYATFGRFVPNAVP